MTWGSKRQARDEVVTHHKTGELGTWVQGAYGRGTWFRPLGWKPKVHMHGPAPAELGDPDLSLCGSGNVKKTTNIDEVTCGRCLNMIRIRNFRVIMFLAAFLLWHRASAE